MAKNIEKQAKKARNLKHLQQTGKQSRRGKKKRRVARNRANSRYGLGGARY